MRRLTRDVECPSKIGLHVDQVVDDGLGYVPLLGHVLRVDLVRLDELVTLVGHQRGCAKSDKTAA